MTTHVDTEEISSTRSEKFLAVILTVFIVIGAGWSYVKIDDLTGVQRGFEYTSEEQQALDAQATATDRLFSAEDLRDSAKVELDIAREDLSLAVDRDQPTNALENDYQDAQERYDRALAEATAADQEADQAGAAATRAEATYSERSGDGSYSRQLLSAALRLALIAGLTIVGLRMISRWRERESRYVPLGFAVAASGVIMAFVFTVDYITDYLDILDLGPIVLSLAGIVATVAAFTTLQKYLARRIPGSRVRKGDCPFCGFPVRAESGNHCEGCGREVVATCATCDLPRRVGSPHCARCGGA